MSFSVGIAGFGLGLLASDCRFTTRQPDGKLSVDRDTPGAKFRRVRGGWVAVGGAGPFTSLGLRMLERDGLDHAAESVQIPYRHVRIDGQIPEGWGEVYQVLREGEDGLELFSISTRYGCTPKVTRRPLPGFAVTSPICLDHVPKGHWGERFERMLAGAGTGLLPVIRAVAQLFYEVRTSAKDVSSVSDQIEIGLARTKAETSFPGRRPARYLTGLASELRMLTDAELVLRMTSPPLPPEWPTEAEQLYFSTVNDPSGWR